MANFLQKWFWRMLILALFVVSLSMILLQANGVQYDALTNQFRKTGIIDISFSDPRAIVYLDGEKLDGSLPFVASNVLPGDYTVVVAKEEFWDYTVKVSVASDLITRVQSVFLAPMQIPVSRLWSMEVPGQQVFLRGGFIFIRNGQFVKWANLKGEKLDFLTAQIPLADFASLRVNANDVLIKDTLGNQGIMDLDDGFFERIKYGDKFQYIGGRWLYFEGDVLALFTRDLDQVVWAKQPRLGEKIVAVRWIPSGIREFLALDFDDGSGALYELKSGNLVPLDKGRVLWAESASGGGAFYLKEDRTLWEYLPKEKRSRLIARFSVDVEMITAAWDAYGAKGVLLFRDRDGYWLADQTFNNVRLIYSSEKIDQLLFQADDRLYFHFKATTDSGDYVAAWDVTE